MRCATDNNVNEGKILSIFENLMSGMDCLELLLCRTDITAKVSSLTTSNWFLWSLVD
jgi:hypothetical protein